MTSEFVIRIGFASGGVAEERGTLRQCQQLIDQDDSAKPLIDYVQAMDPSTGQSRLFIHDGDMRWSACA